MPKRLYTEEKLNLLVGGVAHNINNLLAAMLGQTSLARAKLAAESPARVHLDRAVAACNRAAELTRQLLVYAGKGVAGPRMFSLNALLYEALALVETQFSVSTQWCVDLDVHLSLLAGDANQMRRVLVDLLMYTAETTGGAASAITVRSGVIQVDEEPVRRLAGGNMLAPGAYAFLAVQNNAGGVEMDHQLSLSASLEIIRLHRGGISLERECGQGSTVCLFLPLAAPASLAQSPMMDALEADAQKDTILVVDDEPAVREVLAEAVETAGLHALTAADGRQGLETFRSHQQAIALIVLDMQMPVMNGEETAKELWKLEPGLPLILTSGFFEQRLVDDLVRHPAAAFLPKPYTIDTFLTMLQGRLRLGSRSLRSA